MRVTGETLRDDGGPPLAEGPDEAEPVRRRRFPAGTPAPEPAVVTDTGETPLDGPLGPALLKVIRGNPTGEELAAVVLLLLARSSRTGGRGPVVPVRAANWSLPRPESRSPRSWMSER